MADTLDTSQIPVDGSKPKAQKPRRDDAADPPATNNDFSHPVFKRLSQINGAINKLHKEQVREKLMSLGLNSSGTKEVMKKRLKNYYKNKKLIQSKIGGNRESKYDYILVIDFEATCDSANPENYRHEIIEFPVVVVSCESKTVVDHFHSYVKPTLNPTLTTFCTSLTGITQEQVDKADSFPVVLERMWSWVKDNGYSRRMAILCDGPWDMSRFMYLSCQFNGLRFPKWAQKWINIRKTFSNFYDCKRLNLKLMLDAAGFSFEGQPHCGLDDAKNIARLTVRLLEDGCKLIVNEKLYRAKVNANRQLFVSKIEVKPLSRKQAEAIESDEDDEDDEESLEENDESDSADSAIGETRSECSTNSKNI